MYKLSIELNNLKFYSTHGVFSQENVVGNEFIVHFKGEIIPEVRNLSDDKLEGTVSYADVYDVIGKEMSVQSSLIENVAYRILDTIRKKWPQFIYLLVKVEKSVPPIKSIQGESAVVLEWISD